LKALKIAPVAPTHRLILDRMLTITYKVDTAESVLGAGATRFNILDKITVPVLQRKNLKKAKEYLHKYFETFAKKDIKIFQMRNGESELAGTVIDNDTIGINIRTLEKGVVETTQTLFEEYMHIRTGEKDGTRAFQTSLVKFATMLIIQEKDFSEQNN